MNIARKPSKIKGFGNLIITYTYIMMGEKNTVFIPNGVERPNIRDKKIIKDTHSLEKDNYMYVHNMNAT